MADEIVIGKIGLTPKGEYVSGELYDILDMVSHEGSSYVSKIQNNNIAVTNTEAWLLAAKKGDEGLSIKGDKGDTFTFEDLTTEQKEELKGDVIVYNSMTESDKDDFASRVPITGVIEEGNTQAVSGGEVYENTVHPTSSKILPNAYDYINIDRPDLEIYDLVLVDKNNNIIKKVIFNDSENETSGDDLIELSIDRPDLKFALVDKNNNIIQIEEIEKTKFGFKDLNFFKTNTDYGGFDANTDTFMTNYNELISMYDDIASNINNEFHTTVEKEVLCNSGSSGEPIYFYRIKNDNAKIKILLSAGMHANEKMYIYGLLKVFEEIVLTPYINNSIQWLRDNCEIVIIPCLNRTSLGWDERLLGSRTVAETKPFKASYSGDGTKITITYNVQDFPTENSQLDVNNYFTDNSLAKKRSITIYSTDDDVNIPSGLYVYEVIDGKTITIDAPTSNVVNGEIYIHHWADPNRNVGDNWGIYENYNTSNTIFILDNGIQYSRYDGVGSKENSLQEVKFFVDFINNENFDLVIDAHCPPSKNYIASCKHIMIPNRFLFMNDVKNFMYLFNSDEFVREDSILNCIGSVSYGYSGFYNAVGNRVVVTIEWDSGLVSATSNQVNEAIQFLYAVLVTTVRNSIKNDR